VSWENRQPSFRMRAFLAFGIDWTQQMWVDGVFIHLGKF
jgi:hypothetical protein